MIKWVHLILHQQKEQGDIMVKKTLGGIKHLFIRLFASNAPASLIESLGNLHASLIYMKAVRCIPAYRQLVKAHLGYVPFIVSAKNYCKLPILDKTGYLGANQLNTLIAGKISSAYSIQRSSGFSGIPTYWLKTTSEARNSDLSFRLLWDHYLNPHNEPTLVIVGFSLGTWTSGTDLLRLSNELAIHGGRRVTSISPGENVEETLEIIRNFAKHFKQLIIFGNPLYVKGLVDVGHDIDWTSLKVMFITGGEPTTEAWRDLIAERIGVDIDKDPMRIINAYGASDFGATTATETPLSIRIKRLAMQDANLATAIFGRERNLPNLFQYQPLNHHIEQYGEKFLVTYWSHIPLIRYNIRDRGRVFSFNKIKRILSDQGYDFDQLCKGHPRRPFKLPFLFVDTRDDGTISIGGANVYPANIETALIEHSELQPHIEHFYISVVQDNNCDSRLVVQLIIRDLDGQTSQWIEEFKQNASEAILNTLLRDNREYRVTWENNHSVSPLIQLMKPEKNQVHSIKRRYIKNEPQSGEVE